jgi:hypothetical protein
VIGVDLWNKTPAEVNSFKNTTGATYPLLLYGATATGGNVETLYGPWDNYVILNKQGVVRYHAALTYAHGNRYHLNEIRATVDSLVAPTVGVEDGVLARDGALRVSPNPFLTSAAIEFSAATPLEGEITIHDVQGRRIATLWRGAVDASGVRATWDGRGDSGPAAPGVYIVRARAGDRVLHRRIVRVR